MKAKTVIIADDHQLFAEGLFSMLSDTDYKVVGYAADGVALLHLLSGYESDIVLVDINMPRLNGIESAKHIKTFYPSVKVILLTMHSEQGFYDLAVKHNFDGYLLKNIQRSDLLDAIARVLAGEKVFPKIKDLQPRKTDGETSDMMLALSTLSPREREVLKLIASQKTMGEIAFQLHLSQNTVETYRKNLLRKLGQRSVVGLAVVAVNNGLT
jgi:DNA-binding NarL/FixJ family response regulator